MMGRGGAVPGYARSRRSRAESLHGLLRRPRHSGDGGAAVRAAGAGAGIRGHPDPGPAGHHGGEHRGGFAWGAAPERFFAGEPFRVCLSLRTKYGKISGRGAVGPAGDALQSRRAQAAASAHQEALDIFRGTTEATYCAPMSDMPDGLRRPNGIRQARRFPPPTKVDMSTLVIIGGPRTITDAGAMYGGMLRSIWSRYWVRGRPLLKKSFPPKPHPLSPKTFACIEYLLESLFEASGNGNSLCDIRHSTPSASPRPVRARARPRRASRSCGPLPGAACGCRGSKCGPDYIDPTFHAQATGRPACNLDTWMMGRDGVRALWDSRAHDADAAVCEGVMGLFDSRDPGDPAGGTADCARALGLPIVLVFNGRGMAGSVAALVAGSSFMPCAWASASSEPLPTMGKPPPCGHTAPGTGRANLPPLLGALPRREEWRLPRTPARAPPLGRGRDHRRMARRASGDGGTASRH